jgi:hypothetical protein
MPADHGEALLMLLGYLGQHMYKLPSRALTGSTVLR